MPKDIYLRWYVKYGYAWAAFKHRTHADAFFKERNKFAVCELWDNDTQTLVEKA